MADMVLRWFSKITRLDDTDYRRLLRLLRAERQLPLSKEAERQRRHRAGKAVTVTRDTTVTNDRDSHVTVTRDKAVTVTRDNRDNGHAGVSSITTSFPAFDSFWKCYPKHIGKGEALKAWKKGSCEAKAEIILTAVQAQLAYFEAQGSKYTPNPATWLNQIRWEDEPPLPSLLSEKTRGNIANLQAFVEGVNRGEK